jgi:clumping factor A
MMKLPDETDVEELAAPAKVKLNEIDETDLASLDTGEVVAGDEAASAQSDAASRPEESDASLPEVTPRVVEIEDYSGAGDGSDLHAKIDQDGDGLADDDQKLSRTSDGTWHGDVNRDGYSEDVAFDRDRDGRVESVDTTGRGSSTDTVGADQVVSPESENIVDRQPGEDDSGAAAAADEVGDAASSDTDSDSSNDSDSASDSGSSSDSDSGGSSDDSDPDMGSTTLDSGSSGDTGGSDI